MPRHVPDRSRELLELQHGVIARWQACAIGLDPEFIDTRLRRGRWRRLYHGVYATFTGPPARACLLWAAVLRAGQGAALSYQSAAELDGLTDRAAAVLHVTIPAGRRVVVSAGERDRDTPAVLIHRSRRLTAARHPARTPPRTRIEETVLDLAGLAVSRDEALSWLSSACGRRLTTPAALGRALAARGRIRYRADLAAALGDIGDGAHSVLEFRYVRGVERAHGLPAGRRQARILRGSRSRYLDNLYPDFGVAVELDGRAAHPIEHRWRDIHRDNFCAAEGIVTLRYSWADVMEHPCQVAAEVARALRERGWAGRIRPCPLCRPG